MKQKIVAKRYVNAFKNSLDERDVDDCFECLQTVLTSIVEHAGFYSLLRNPLLSQDEKMGLLAPVFQLVSSKKIETFFELLVQKKRVSLLADMLGVVSDLLMDVRNEIDVNVVSASPFGENEAAVLKRYLEEVSQKRVTMTVDVNSDLVGGFRAEMGQLVYDATLDSALEKLKISFN